MYFLSTIQYNNTFEGKRSRVCFSFLFLTRKFPFIISITICDIFSAKSQNSASCISYYYYCNGFEGSFETNMC